MAIIRSIRGKLRPGATTDWTSLEKLLGGELCSHFMWMSGVDLEDGTRIDAYKHRWTRCYLHLSKEGRTYDYIWRDDDYDDGCYREVEPEAAIFAAFAGWESCRPTESERAALHVAVRTVRARHA